VIFGYSLGGAVALDLASRVDEKATIAMSTFSSTHDAAHDIYPWLPTQLFTPNQFVSTNAVQSLNSPLLLIHAERDQVLNADFSKELYAAASEPKELWLIPDANHQTIVETISTEESLQRIRAFITQ
jgi:pimeloyl-ACP methyl ester carboxylesterase